MWNNAITIEGCSPSEGLVVQPTVSIHNNKFSFARKGQLEDLKCRTTVCWLPDPAVGASSDPHDPLGSEERLAAPP